MNTRFKRSFAVASVIALALIVAWVGPSIGRPSHASQSQPSSAATAPTTNRSSAPTELPRESTHAPDPIVTPLAPSSAAPPSSVPDSESSELETWARQRPDEALAWARQTPNGPGRVVVTELLCLQLARRDPAAAIALAAELRADGYVLDNVVQQWAERDFASAQAYVSNLARSPDRDRLVARVALVEAKTHPANAATHVASQISPGQIQADAAIAVLHQWLEQDRSSALAWLDKFPRGEVRDRALDEIDAVLVTPGP
jgi:hypothetical protein